MEQKKRAENWLGLEMKRDFQGKNAITDNQEAS